MGGAARDPDSAGSLRVVAIIAAYNEADILDFVLAHLATNGLETYLIDNHSTDQTLEIANSWIGRGVIGVEVFPPPPAPPSFVWADILTRKTEIAHAIGADWYIHHDADELRDSPWPNISLRDAIAWADRLGYTAVDFKLFNFPPVDDGFSAGMNPSRYFSRFEEPAQYDRLQVKCWKGVPADFVLAEGGHDVQFSSRRVCPIRFILRHYPIRSAAHGSRKVFIERRGRFSEAERILGWHVQYDHVRESGDFLRNPAALMRFDLEQARLQAQLEATPEGYELPSPATPVGVGVLDFAGPDVIAGWASTDGFSEPVEVDLWDGAHHFARVKADLFRQDLLAAGKGDGHAGFALPVPAHLRDGRRHWIWANVAGTSLALRGSPTVLLAHSG